MGAQTPRASQLRLIAWPYHNGLRGAGMGAGAARLADDRPFRTELETAGWQLVDDEVPPADELAPEVARVAELIRRLSRHVARAAADGAFPLVLAGNCSSCLGTTAGVGAERIGVVWFDAHADFDDPEENVSGFFDVMSLAMLTGRGWAALRATIPGHRPIPEGNVLLAGVRDLEPHQRRRLEASDVLVVPGAIETGRFEEAVTQLSSRVSRVYLHVDLDALDAGVARANRYAAPGGPGLDRLVECIRGCCERFSVAAAALTAYDPGFDDELRTLAAARRIAGEIARGTGAGVDPGRSRSTYR